MKHFHLVGHRGAGGEKFENSMSGFKHALSLDISAVELDIRAQAGDLWVIHDLDLERLTGSSGKFDQVADPAQLRLLNGEPIPRLREVLDLFWGKMPLNIEIKSPNTATLLLELLSTYAPLPPNPEFPWILISSFDHRQLLSLRQQSCRWELAPISYGVALYPEPVIEALQPYSWHIDDEYLDLSWVKSIQQAGVKVLIYTVNDGDQARHYQNLGIDGLFTDHPSTLMPDK